MSKLPINPVTSLHDLDGKRVLVRVSINVPIEDGEVRNQFRVTRGLATINYLINQNARVILVGHIGRSGEESTKPVADLFDQYVPTTHSPEITGSETKNLIEKMPAGQVVLLENVRKDPRETENDEAFGKELADLADIYVNDAFAASHREHASLSAVTKFLPSYAGMNFMHEYEELTKASKPASPALFMLGGAKFDTKMPLVKKFLDIYDHVFIGGALANDCFKAKGYEVGQSLVSDGDLGEVEEMLENAKLLLPVDVVVERAGERVVVPPDAVETADVIYDVGPESVKMLQSLICNAASILWNGPFGNYEKGYDEQTMRTAELVADAPGYAVIGGGDTVASIESLFCQEKIAFLSTAGGAMLHFLEHGTLPAIAAMQQAPSLVGEE